MNQDIQQFSRDRHESPRKFIRWDENDRLSALRSYNILDTARERAFDDFVHLASVICDTPMALISFIDADRQWFKARIGIDFDETPIDVAFCGHAILQQSVFVVADTADDTRFTGNRLVTEAPHIRFYASAPLMTEGGIPLGTLCVMDISPHPDGLNAAQITSLEALARQVMVQIEIGRVLSDRAEAEAALVCAHRHTCDILDSIEDPFYVVDKDFIITFGNVSFFKAIGRTPVEVVGHSLLNLFQAVQNIRETGGIQAIEAVMRERRSARVEIYSHTFHWWCEMSAYPMSDGGVAVSIKNIDDRKRIEHALVQAHDTVSKALAEKETLMLEVHHRVKNSLQMVQSLLILQSRSIEDPAVARQVQESAARIRTFSALHETLYQVSDSARVDIRSYLEKLVCDLNESIGDAIASRTIRLEADTVLWPASDVSALGLVLTELVINAIKYGEGTVTVRFEQGTIPHHKDDGARLIVEDEGVGLPLDFDPNAERGLGMRLVTRLLRERHSCLKIDRSVPQTRFLVALPKPVLH